MRNVMIGTISESNSSATESITESIIDAATYFYLLSLEKYRASKCQKLEVIDTKIDWAREFLKAAGIQDEMMFFRSDIEELQFLRFHVTILDVVITLSSLRPLMRFIDTWEWEMNDCLKITSVGLSMKVTDNDGDVFHLKNLDLLKARYCGQILQTPEDAKTAIAMAVADTLMEKYIQQEGE